MRNKTAETPDEILNNDIDLFFITESWLSGEFDENFIITQAKRTKTPRIFITTAIHGTSQKAVDLQSFLNES